ncbi:MAG: fluoride efflux transporter CrcB [Rhizobiales bacterium]|nr:fluoride efflux transporter CrcB [Hyphomicrobiales bacterium]
MHVYLIVFLGGGIGATMRHGVNLAAARIFGTGLPFGTLIVNIVGSFVMGLLVEWFALKTDPGQHWRLFFTTGLLGGFTTFSAFSLDTALLVERGIPATAMGYALVSVLASIGGLFLGLFVVRTIAQVSL